MARDIEGNPDTAGKNMNMDDTRKECINDDCNRPRQPGSKTCARCSPTNPGP